MNQTEVQITYLNSDKFNTSSNITRNVSTIGNIQDEIMPALESLLSEFVSSFGNYLDDYLNIERVRFTLFIIGSCFIFFFVWSPYLKKVSNNIWRTKGMLNMIPMDVITRNERLKDLFTSGELLQAVQ